MPQQRKTDQCAVDVEEGPKDLYCYCERCCYQRSFQGVMKTVSWDDAMLLPCDTNHRSFSTVCCALSCGSITGGCSCSR